MAEGASVSHSELVAELRAVRRSGLHQLRAKIGALPTLTAIAQQVYASSTADAVEQLLRDAWHQLGSGPHGTAVGTLFGLEKGRRGGNPADLRAAAAAQLGYATVETFRKRPEASAIEDFAGQIASLGAQRKVRTAQSDDKVGTIVAQIEALTSLELAELARQLSHRLGPLPARA